MHIRIALACALAPLSTIAWAGEQPAYAPAPDWVTPAPPLDPAKLPADAPAFLLLDQQQMLKEGEIWGYADTAMRATTAESLTQMGTITLPWHPSKGDLTIHRVQILRGAETIDLIAKGSRFSVIRREAQLEQHHINGILSATLPVEGLRVGDILRLSFSISHKDAALGGNVETALPLPAAPMRLHFGRARLLWPENAKVNWRSFGDGIATKPVRRSGFWELALTLPLTKQPEVPGDAPPRYQRPPLVEASSFANWTDVSRTASALYGTKGLIASESPLAAEVAKIAAATTDPRRRAAMALQLVQDQIRYLFNGMGNGNYVPQAPAETWQLRYGDCKAKTLLLLALLHELGVEAEPVLANSGMGDWVAERLPAFGAFDHVLVRAVIGSETLWLDGTQGGTRVADLGDAPPFRNVLPARAEGAEIMLVPTRPSARPDVSTELEIDQSAGISFPTTYKIALTLRGSAAAQMRQMSTQADKTQIADFVQGMIGPYVNEGVAFDHKMRFDDAAGTATIEASGLGNLKWTKQDQRYGVTLDKAITGMEFEIDRSRLAWKDIPVSRNYPFHYGLRTTVKLPNRPGFELEGDASLSETIAGADVRRNVSLKGDVLVVEENMASREAEIPATEIPAVRARLALANTRLFRVRAPEGYPARWQDVIKAKAERRFDPLLAAYERYIEVRPDEAVAYVNRARFLDGIYEWRKALTDLDKVVSFEPSVDNYLWRARLLTTLGEPKKALADIEAARALDPGSEAALAQLASHYAEHGDTAKALELVEARIAAGGSDKPGYLAFKATLLADDARAEEAIATIDAAIAAKPGDPELLNNRCWIKGTRNVALESALRDCTKAIELAERPAQMLDSRAMVYFRLGRLEDALADLEAAYALNPSIPAIMYLRGIVKQRSGDKVGAEADLAAARLMWPRIDWYYGRYGVKPDTQ